MAPIENFFWAPSAGVQAGMLAIRNDCVGWRKREAPIAIGGWHFWGDLKDGWYLSTLELAVQ